MNLRDGDVCVGDIVRYKSRCITSPHWARDTAKVVQLVGNKNRDIILETGVNSYIVRDHSTVLPNLQIIRTRRAERGDKEKLRVTTADIF